MNIEEEDDAVAVQKMWFYKCNKMPCRMSSDFVGEIRYMSKGFFKKMLNLVTKKKKKTRKNWVSDEKDDIFSPLILLNTVVMTDDVFALFDT